MCYVSLEFPVLKLRQGMTLIAHTGTMFSHHEDVGLTSLNIVGKLEY